MCQGYLARGQTRPQAAFERGRGLLLREGWGGVCAWVSELLSVETPEELTRRQKATEKLLGYFAKHTNRLAYRDRLASGRAIGSGAVEGQAKTLGLRLKARGARWLKKNVRPMASSGLRSELHPVAALLELGGLTPENLDVPRLSGPTTFDFYAL